MTIDIPMNNLFILQFDYLVDSLSNKVLQESVFFSYEFIELHMFYQIFVLFSEFYLK